MQTGPGRSGKKQHDEPIRGWKRWTLRLQWWLMSNDRPFILTGKRVPVYEIVMKKKAGF
jgi:hypothetical protein